MTTTIEQVEPCQTPETPETLAQFTERMSKVESIETLIIGRASSGNTRTIYSFEGQKCYLESCGYIIDNRKGIPSVAKAVRMAFASEPKDFWSHHKCFYGKNRAAAIAKVYNASIERAPYQEDKHQWHYLMFNTFEDLMRFVYDTKTGQILKQFGDKESKIMAEILQEEAENLAKEKQAREAKRQSQQAEHKQGQ